ncbi:MAG: hypothetical protein KC550_05980 [Nanoarchaeota archaeon]|nr:hypothetical protein [Nanoarchaeota archaeon]
MADKDYDGLVVSLLRNIDKAIIGLKGSVPKNLGFEYKIEKKNLDIEIVFHSNFSGSKTIYIEFIESEALFNVISDDGEFHFNNTEKLVMYVEKQIDEYIEISFKELEKKRA